MKTKMTVIIKIDREVTDKEKEAVYDALDDAVYIHFGAETFIHSYTEIEDDDDGSE
jgi:hypothetical protein